MLYSRGSVVVRCVRVGGLTLDGHGQVHFDEGQEMDLMAPTTPEALRAGDYAAAIMLVRDPGYEFGRRVEAGEFRVVSRIPPKAGR